MVYSLSMEISEQGQIDFLLNEVFNSTFKVFCLHSSYPYLMEYFLVENTKVYD